MRKLIGQGIIIRSMKSFGQNNAIRVTIGSLEQNQRFIKELHACLKTVIGITGRTGSGKSLACKWITANIKRVEHIDCDDIGHQVLEMADIKPKLLETFGNNIDEDGKINRKKLGDIVFNNKQELLKLNDIVHPKICDEVNNIIKTTEQSIIIIEGALFIKLAWNMSATTPYASTPHQSHFGKTPRQRGYFK